MQYTIDGKYLNIQKITKQVENFVKSGSCEALDVPLSSGKCGRCSDSSQLGNGTECIVCNDINNMTISTGATSCSCKPGYALLSSGKCGSCQTNQYLNKVVTTQANATASPPILEVSYMECKALPTNNIKYNTATEDVNISCPAGFKPNTSNYTSCIVDPSSVTMAVSSGYKWDTDGNNGVKIVPV
jgi:hypothetical protein